jgi:flagellar hook-length control protein FliK
MKILTDKQPPALPAKPNTQSTASDVMNFLTGYLFAAMYAPAAGQPVPSPLEQQPQLEEGQMQEAAIDGAAEEGQSVTLITQLLQAVMQPQPEASQSEVPLEASAAQSASSLLVQDNKLNQINMQQQIDQVKHEDEPVKNPVKIENSFPVTENIPPAAEELHWDKPLNKVQRKTDVLDQVSVRDREFAAGAADPVRKSLKADVLQQMPAQMLDSPQQEISVWQKPMQEWLVSVNHQSHPPRENGAVELPQVNQQVVMQASTSTLTDIGRLSEQPPRATANSEQPQVTFHLEQAEPVPHEQGSYQMNIRVNPPELGPVHAKIKMSKNRVELVIVTRNHATEQTIKLHLPQLTEKFSQSSLRLDVTVQHAGTSMDQGDQQPSNKVFDYTPDELTQGFQRKSQSAEKSKENEDALIDTYI